MASTEREFVEQAIGKNLSDSDIKILYAMIKSIEPGIALSDMPTIDLSIQTKRFIFSISGIFNTDEK